MRDPIPTTGPKRPRGPLGLLLVSAAIAILLPGRYAIAPAVQAAELEPLPDRLAIAGQRCLFDRWDCQPGQRQLLLRAEATLDGVRVQALDLEATGAAAVVPATAIRAQLAADRLEPLQPLPVVVTVDWRGVASGEFVGSLLVTHAAGLRPIPVTVTVKDHWLPPLLVLVLGLSVGIATTAYRQEGQARDRVLVQAGRLRSELRADAALAAAGEQPSIAGAFARAVQGELIEVESALANQRWAAAQAAVAAAQGMGDRWRQGRADWLAQSEHAARLQQRLEEEDPEGQIPSLERVRWQLDQVQRGAAQVATPLELSEQLRAVQASFERFLQGRGELERRPPTARLASEQQRAWQQTWQGLEAELHNLPLDSPEELRAWRDRLRQAQQDLNAALSQAASPAAETIATTRSADLAALGAALRPVPVAVSAVKALAGESPGARWRLWAFQGMSYVVTFAVLLGAGYSQLYAARPTFGAGGVADYAALLAWGFGAEATRESLAKVLQAWQERSES